MRYIIWNKTQDKYWDGEEWSNRYYAKRYNQRQMEDISSTVWFDGTGDEVVGLIYIHV